HERRGRAAGRRRAAAREHAAVPGGQLHHFAVRDLPVPDVAPSEEIDMADPFVAGIRIFGFNFAPKGWAVCHGPVIARSQNTALFSLLGTMYGGDGKSTFGLPNMQGNAPLFWGQAQSGTLYDEGQTGGSENITLLQTEMPTHTHQMRADTLDNADTNVV